MIEIEVTDELLSELLLADLKERKKYLFKINKPYLQYLIGIVVKFNDNYIHVRYLDNPHVENSYWWTGGETAGIDPLKYSMNKYKDFIMVEDMIPNGYDDIIKKKYIRMFEVPVHFPYYDSKYGNVYVNVHFKELYDIKKEFILENFDNIPEEIKLEHNVSNRKRISNITDILSDMNLNEQDLKRFISYQLDKKKRIDISKKYEIEIDIIENIKKEFKNNSKTNYNTDIYLKVIGELLKKKITLYNYDDEYNYTVDTITNEGNSSIFLYKTDNILYKLE
tara:strand:- start:341 stop:1177 length:837 start_codon:yes stop_codon:yes gene_type:complete